MCGIAGFINKSSPADPTWLRNMLSAISHRGPDALSGIVQEGTAIGAARLSIVDLEGGKQPAFTADRKVIVAFNGEIFNYMELRSDLLEKGHSFRTRSEIETLLNLYLHYREEMFSRLRGQFAIAIWDGRENELFLARDRMGIRPLFWSKSNEGIVFASEIKAISQMPKASLRLNTHSILQTFRFWTNVNDTTAFDNILQLPPGSYLRWSGGTSTCVRYWEWPIPGSLEPIKLNSDVEYAEALVENLNWSIKRQAMADVPVASYLSGGVDSSAIATLFNDQTKRHDLHTYSVAFDDPQYDESAAQKLMVDSHNFKHTTITVTPADIAAVFPEVVRHAETPLFRTAPAPLYLLSKRVHEDGYKVVMTGEGADEILLGYDIFRETTIRRFWSRQPGSKIRGNLIGRLYDYLPQYKNPRYLALLLDFYRPFLADDTNDPHYAMAVRWANGKALSGYFGPQLKAASQSYDPINDLNAALPKGYLAGDDIDRAQCVENHCLLSNYLLSTQGDRMSMAHSVEGRYPYLDDEFIAFAARLPRKLKLRGLKDKFILRKAFAGRIPKAIAHRPKVAYQAPDLKAFFVDGKAPDYVYDLISRTSLSDTGIFDAGRVEQLVRKAKSYNLERVGMRDNMAFVLILSTMLLHESFVKNKGKAAVVGDAKLPIIIL